MAARRTVDLLPEIFRTDTNRKFLSATLDQLTQEPNIKRTRGYVGRRIGPGVNPSDNYVIEPTASRNDYQLEPGVVFLKPDTNTATDAITFPGMLDALAVAGADTQKQDRLFNSQYYTWDPFCDLDKFNNYSQYYWLPEGPDSVDISSSEVPITDDFEVTRKTMAYTFSGIAGDNPIITLVRGGNYTFELNQPNSGFWIQTAPGVNGRIPSTPNISSRDVLGVINNGESQGTVSFNVPLKTAQDFFYGLNDIGSVDLITDLKFNQINNVYVSNFLQTYPGGIDGITNLDGRTVVFTNTIEDAVDGGWLVNSQYDPLAQDPDNTGLEGAYDTTLFDQTTEITSQAQRYSVWQIQYIFDDAGQAYMRLTSVLQVSNLSRFRVKFGTQWSSTQWYKNASGYFEIMPLLTAVLDTLYYQDGTNPEIFGQIKLVDPGLTTPIDLEDIIGAKNYTSPNGVVFTNGLKVQFRGLVEPAQFQNLEYYVEGVGTGPGLPARVGFVDGQAYFGPSHIYQGRRYTGAAYQEGVFQQYIYDSLEESIANPGAGAPENGSLPTDSQPGAAAGNGIRLIPVQDFVTPETYTRSETIPYDSTSYDSTPWDASLNAPLVQDYITINRASRDRNAWTRSNRWFHVDVIRYSAELNNTTVVLDNDARGKRPIIEFRPNLELWNFGTQGKQPIDIIDFEETDALSNINGQIGYSLDGYNFIQGTRVIFAADVDPDVRNRVYQVDFIDPDGNINSPKIINLTPVDHGQALVNQTVVILNGINQQGKSYWFDGLDWILAQQKTNVNQPPLFNVYDANARSFGDAAVYPSTTFAGSRLFGYAQAAGDVGDEVLGFPLRYLNINNVGDILFENYFYTDTFDYVEDNVGQTLNISQGFAREYVDRVDFSQMIGWLPAATESRSRQIFRFIYDGTSLILDIAVNDSTDLPPLEIFVEGVFVDPTKYAFTTTANNTFISFTGITVSEGTIIEVQALSNQASQVGYYQVPLNLENNALNNNSEFFTLGTIRTHYETIGQNLRNIQGPVNGANNTRDLGNILVYGNNIVQQSSPLTLAGVFLRKPQYDITSALIFNSQEYQKYKAKLLELVTKGDYVNKTSTQVLDEVLLELTAGRNEQSPFYWSDMIPAGEVYTSNTYTYSVISTPTFDTVQTYNFDSANYLGLLIFLNGNILQLGYDYTVGDGTPTVTITVPLSVGDKIEIREYPNTYGSFVPNTPTKIGLYPAFQPEIYLDTTYVRPTQVIRGHDGSITVAYGDIRDQVLLEFETRIFNNLKTSTAIPLTADEVIPGQFRTTDYTLAEINDILSQDFLSWVGWNKLDYATQTYLADNEFTFNYSQSANRLDAQPLLGNWRGIYQYFYDTVFPDSRPWEMLGFSQEPEWWVSEYGPAPYTSGNMVLWDDLANGLVRDPAGEYVLPRYARPGLTDAVPVGSEGELLPPLDTTVGNYDATSFRRSWAFGDGGPVEYAWRSSSAYPFAIMRLLALTKPAKFFSLFVDRDRYQFDRSLEQFVWDGRYRLDANLLAPLYGDGQSRASYVNWIIDYNRQLGINSTTALTDTLENTDIRLCWRVAGYTDKKFMKLFTVRSTPGSTNAGLLLPDESYQILLYQNQAFDQNSYSSVIIQSTDTGWAVLGYSTTRPYFEILTSLPNGLTTVIESGGSTVRVAADHTDEVVQVPYGYVFTSRTAVCDFLISYGKLLERQGFTFANRENGYVLDWYQMAQEFLYWSNQGWVPGSLINLNPLATSLTVEKTNAVAESLVPLRPDNIVLNQNRQAIPMGDLVINRLGTTFNIAAQSDDTINYINLRFTAFEHLIILDNRSIFADLIYDPTTGARQSRIQVSGSISGDWDGTLNAPGFVLNQDNIQEWAANRTYPKGTIVLFKNEYWSALETIQPSQMFDYSLWVKTEYDQIQKGLLPNAANSANQLVDAYSINAASLEEEVDLFSYGLIGFRPREYMQALNLDDVSQVNLYQQFLGTKGTLRSAEIFSLANLGKEIAEYDIYEYWSILRSTYGANANRSYFELLLNEADLFSDPSLIQVVQPQETSEADQTVLVDDIWNSSYKITSPDILPTVGDFTTLSDQALPSAGYVNFDDVDFTTFSLEETTADQLAELGIGSTLWVAKVNPYDWNIYNARRVPADVVQVSDNLDGRSLVQFDNQHGLLVGDWVIIKFFDEQINGAYRVLSVPSLYTVVIEFAFTGQQTSITGIGVALTLQSARVAQPSDILDLSYAEALVPGARVWVDNDGQGRWTVLEKTAPFTVDTALVPLEFDTGSRFGSSVSQGFENLTALVGAPGYNTTGALVPSGAVYAFVRTDENQYAQKSLIILNATGAQGLGNDVDVGGQDWAIAGASESNSNQGYALLIYRDPSSGAFSQRRLLVAPDLELGSIEFGSAVTLSQDERWLLIGAPGESIHAPGGQAYLFAQVEVQPQSVQYITDGTSVVYNWSDHIKITGNEYQQFVVVLDNRLLTYNVDYTVSAQNIVFAVAPQSDLRLIIQRLTGIQLDQQVYRGVEQDSTSGAGAGATFTVNRTRGDYVVELTSGGFGYAISDTITIDAATVGGGTSPTNDITITVVDVNVLGTITEISYTGSGVDNTAVFDLTPYLATVDSIWSFGVVVNDIFLRPEIDYEYNTDGTLEFTGYLPPPGATILVDAQSYYEYHSTISVDDLGPGARFGASVSMTTNGRTFMIGAPGADNGKGRVYIYDRAVESRTYTTSSTGVFNTVRPLTGATAVTVNNQYLLNTNLNIGGTFTVTGASQVTVLENLQVGDVIEIETNQINLVQTLTSANEFDSAQYGYRIDQCVNDCSLYVAAPYDGSMVPEGGKVEFNQNQARVYGTITSTIANPVLTSGTYLRINNVMIECTGTTVEDLLEDIVNAAVPNTTASLTPDLTIRCDGNTSVFDVGTIYSAASSYNTKVYQRLSDTENFVLLTAGSQYTYNNTTQQITLTATPPLGASLLVVSGRLTISVKNINSAPALNKIRVAPGTGNLWTALGFDTYVQQQTIRAPVQQAYAHFGEGLFISDNTVTLMIGAPNGTLIRPTTFDSGATYFDADSTDFADPIVQSGVVYQYDYLPSVSASTTNPAQFVFGQQLYDNSIAPLDQFGAAIDYTTGTLLMGAPGTDFGDSQANYGRVAQMRNINREPAWKTIRLQTPVVDVDLLNTIYMYDIANLGSRQYFDFFDPLQGRLLGAVQQNIDFKGAVDPARYNIGPVNNFGNRWGAEYLGKIWLDTNNIRWIDPNQDDIVYASRRWGQIFPGSTVNVYQWISSRVPPSQYDGIGIPRSIDSYVVIPTVDEQGIFRDVYYYWVSGIDTVDRVRGKTLSAATVAQYIESPRTSGISYIAPLSPSALGIYNGRQYISAQDTVLYVEFDKQLTDNAVHVQYQLVPEGKADGFLVDNLYRKLLDSFCGVDTAGNLVPDPFLAPSQRYGVQFRPRQSMFVNRFLALENYLTETNKVLALFPVAINRTYRLLNSADPEPTAGSGAWDARVDTYQQLTFQDLDIVPLGYKYLVVSDSTNNGLWTIYQVAAGDLPGSRQLNLVRVQTYDTRKYWTLRDWYAANYDPFTRIVTEVPVYSALEAITVPLGSSVKVTANSQGKWEIYRLEASGWVRVGLEDGTIEFSAQLWNYQIGRNGFDVEVFDAQYFDQEPVIETRRVLQSINEELFTGDLLLERNRLLILMFNFILSEQIAPTWLTKTSLIDVNHVIRDLAPFQIYRQDNQDFVLNYINEVKPYHTQIRQFGLIYRGSDVYQGTVNDFDLPAYWDPSQSIFVSPVLDDVGNLSTTSSVPSTSAIWQTLPWDQWYQNYLLSILDVTVIEGGTGYTTPPEVTVTGECTRQAVMTARINSAGAVVAIEVVDPGLGYSTTAIITLVGGNGTGAKAVAVMGNQLVRSITTTIKYDRYQYTSDITDWTANVVYTSGDRVRYSDRVYSADGNVQSATFDIDDWTLVPAGSLSGIDRTRGYYAPSATEPGLDLALLISGLDYPGVQVSAPTFSQDTGFDVGNFDINPFDNISFGPEGRPTYDPAILDAIYESSFTDTYLGTRPTDINVDGGAFVDTYSSHAPEELVPGAIFDTLDLRVYTTPGSDWDGAGHGFPLRTIRYEYDPASPTLSFAGILDYAVGITVFNVSQNLLLNLGTDYSVDWVDYEITMLNGTVEGDIISIVAESLGGGNQLLSRTIVGNQIVDRTIIVPRPLSDIFQTVVFVNGVQTTAFTATAFNTFSTQIVFTNTYGASDRVTYTVLGYGTTTNYSWSLPLTQYIIANGGLNYTLTNSLQGTNPANIIVSRNGVRARPSEGIEYTGNGSTTVFNLPSRGGYSQGLIADNDVTVYVDNVPLTLGTQFVVDAWDGSTLRSVTLTTAPAAGARVLISVRTAAQYWITGDQLIFRPSQGLSPLAGDIISVTTFNDTAEQNIATLVFVGPETQGAFTSEPYDSTSYDTGSITGDPGSYDYGVGTVIETNHFELGRVVSQERLVVSLDGNYLFPGFDYEINGTQIIILGPIIATNSVVAVTLLTTSEVPGEIAFRIFQDMRGLQTTYRITDATTTLLALPVTATADEIYVTDASRLPEPNLENGIFGLITIQGERITYRNRDTANNKLSGLRRGTAGTGAAAHAAGVPVYSIGASNKLPQEYQNYIVADYFLGDGVTTVFTAEDIVVEDLDSSELVEAVEVYVGGIRQLSGYDVIGSGPVAIEFDTAPNNGYQVAIVVSRGKSWYQPGASTPSDGVPLQETNTIAARFIRGF